jgi:hypothetical protein
VKSDSVHSCTETFSIFLEILRAKSDAGASMQCVCRPKALPYPYGRRLEVLRVRGVKVFPGRVWQGHRSAMVV